MAANKRARQSDEPTVPGWVLTYGDMMSLLLTFFILLASFSTIHREDFQEAAASIQQALGVLPGALSAIDWREIIPEMRAQQALRDVGAKIAEYIQVHGKQNEIQVELTKEGLKLTMQNPILFDIGEDRLKPEAIPILNDIAVLLAEVPDGMISVDGHSDNIPIHTDRFPSNLELSAGRALSVARFFIDTDKVDPKNLSVVGYGENLPIASNDSPEGRQKNRRVEINVLTARPTAHPNEGRSERDNEETEHAS